MRRVIPILCCCALVFGGLSAWLYVRGVHRAEQREEERLLFEHTAVARALIEAAHQFEAKEGRAPRSIDELVDGGYLKGPWNGPTFYPNRFFDSPMPPQPGNGQPPPAS